MTSGESVTELLRVVLPVSVPGHSSCPKCSQPEVVGGDKAINYLPSNFFLHLHPSLMGWIRLSRALLPPYFYALLKSPLLIDLVQ